MRAQSSTLSTNTKAPRPTAIRVLTLTLIYAGRYHLRFRVGRKLRPSDLV